MAVGDKLEIVEFGGVKYQAVDQGVNTCGGCISNSSSNPKLCDNQKTECRSFVRPDQKSIIWIKLEEEQPVSKPDTIKEIRAKTLTLQNEIYKLIEAFETDTGMVLHRVDITRHSQIGGKSVLALPELDVRLN